MNIRGIRNDSKAKEEEAIFDLKGKIHLCFGLGGHLAEIVISIKNNPC